MDAKLLSDLRMYELWQGLDSKELLRNAHPQEYNNILRIAYGRAVEKAILDLNDLHIGSDFSDYITSIEGSK